jgi:hypothetical protein
MSALDESAAGGGAAEPTDEEREIQQSLANSDVTTKYLEAAKISNLVLQEVIALCVPDASIIDICKHGDGRIIELVSNIYKNKKDKEGNPIEKGCAFPVCISVNEILCHCSPLVSEAASVSYIYISFSFSYFLILLKMFRIRIRLVTHMFILPHHPTHSTPTPKHMHF